MARRAARIKTSVLVPPAPLPEPAAALALSTADVSAKDEIAVERLRLLTSFYRTTPQLIRPTTPSLVLDSDQPDAANPAFSVDDVDRAATLVQSLLRGRAVQNLFFEGRVRCHGLLGELQGASATMAQEAVHAVVITKRNTQLGALDFADGVVTGICGAVANDVITDTVTLLPHLRAVNELRALAMDAEVVRAQREAKELDRRAAVAATAAQRAAIAAAVRDAASSAAQTFTDACFDSAARGAARDAAVAAAVAADEAASVALCEREEGEDEDEYAARLACDIMDALVLPQVRVGYHVICCMYTCMYVCTYICMYVCPYESESGCTPLFLSLFLTLPHSLSHSHSLMHSLTLTLSLLTSLPPQLRRRRTRVHGSGAIEARAIVEVALEAVGDAATLADAAIRDGVPVQ